MPPPQGPGRDTRRYAFGLRPPPSPAGRPDRAPVVILAALIPLLVVGLGWLLYDARAGAGSSPPDACSLLSQAQVDTYLPGAEPGADGDFYHCPWSRPAAGGGGTGTLTVTVEALSGESPRVEDAMEQYDNLRVQAGGPGTTITLPSLGDESFMVRGAPRGGAPGDVETYTRVGDVVFGLALEGSPPAGARDPATSLPALAGLAVEHLRRPA
jgi:hypothetical protein